MTTPHLDHSLYFFRMNELMRELGHHPERANFIASEIRGMGNPPCPVCGMQLEKLSKGKKGSRKYAYQCDSPINPQHSVITWYYTTELRALKATRQWLQEEA